MLMLLATLLSPAQAAPPQGATDLTDMVALYAEICLATFPIDDQVDVLMARKGAKPLTADEVKITLRDDPGRAWAVEAGGRSYSVFLELPPFHACSVRANVGGGPLDLASYRAAADTFKRAHRGFTPQPPMDVGQGDIHIHADSEYRQLPGGAGEQLMVIDQHITNPERRAKGETGAVLRFVHQIRTPN